MEKRKQLARVYYDLRLLSAVERKTEMLKAIIVFLIMYSIFCVAASPRPHEREGCTKLPPVLRFLLFLPSALLGSREFRIVIVPFQAGNLFLLICYAWIKLFADGAMYILGYLVIAVIWICLAIGLIWHFIHKSKL